MINEYEKLNMMVKEDISWSEYACCYEYANQVIDYCKDMGHDLTGPSAAEWAIIDYDQKENSFSDQYGYEISDYFGTIIAEIGMIVEAS